MNREPVTVSRPALGAGSSSLLAAGSRLGAYRVVALLGRGGMGEVYEGWDERLARPVALKRIAAANAHDPDARARFWREARALAALRHPGIVTIYEIGEEALDGALFLAMEKVAGSSLATLTGVVPLRLALHLARQVADALGAAHAVGIAHRDVKPANILVDDQGAVRLVDFGLARRAGEDSLTRRGAPLGTPGYMAPETLSQDGPVGPAADVFAVGILLYRWLSGVHPFARATPEATALALAGAVHKPLAELAPALPSAVAALVERCLALRPAERPSDGAALAAELARHAPDDVAPRELERGLDTARAVSPVRRVRRPLALAALGLAALALAVGITSALVNDRSYTVEPTPVVPPVAASPLPLPPRPAVVVLGFAAERPADAARADVLADVVRVRLDEDPAHVVAASLELTGALIASGPTIDAHLDPMRLARPGRARGHIDVALRGRFADALDGRPAHVEAELVETVGGRVLDTIIADAPDVMSLADILGARVLVRLGGVPPDEPVQLTRVPEAWSAWMLARHGMRQAELGVVADNVAWALRLDADFGLAAAEELPMLRMQSRTDELVQRADTLLAAQARHQTLPDHSLRYVEALRAFGKGELAECLRELYAIAERYPFDIDATALLVTIRAKGEGRDVHELERLARQQLTLGPRLDSPAIRLVGALATQNRVAEAEAFIDGLGVPADDPVFADVHALLDLHAGRFAAAAAAFQRVFAADAGNLYAEHMVIVAELLGGRCDRAAGLALDRIERQRLSGTNELLAWTYSLATQALMGWEQWDALEQTLRKWEAFDEDGRAQAAVVRERAARVRAELVPPAERAEARLALAKRWRGLLQDPAFPKPARDTVIGLLAWVSDDPVELERLIGDARAAAVDTSRSSVERLLARLAVAQREGRRAVLAGDASALGHFDAGVLAWDEVQGEGESTARVIGLAYRALAAEALGDPARARTDWQAIAELGYPRLWATELWVLARHRLLEDASASAATRARGTE